MTFHISPPGHSSPNKYMAEFLGTFVLVLTIGLNADGTFKVLSIASALVIMIFAMGPVSGGHFNPAVTLTVFINKKITIVDAVIYVISQILGAQAARGLVWQMKGGEFDFHPTYGSDAFPWQVFFAEFAYTTVLCYVVLNAACRKEPNPAFGLAIGLVVVAGGYSVGGISGGAFNPAVASTFHMSCLPVCLVAEFLASFLASLLFSLVYIEDEDGSKNVLTSRLWSEFIGTFVLVMTVGFNVMMGSPAGALSIGMSLTVMIFEDHGVSGGHLNPAVTSAISARSGSDRAGKSFELYAAVQLFAGFCAGAFSALVCGLNTEATAFHTLPFTAFHNTGNACIAEMIYTFVLCFVVLGIATVTYPASSAFNGLTVGLCVVAGGNAAGTFSGGHLNPAVSTGLLVASVMHGQTNWEAFAKYILSQIVGGLLAAGMFRAIFVNEFEMTNARELHEPLKDGA